MRAMSPERASRAIMPSATLFALNSSFTAFSMIAVSAIFLSLELIEFDVCFARDFREGRHIFPQKCRELFGRVADGELVQLFEPGFDVRRLRRAGESRVQALYDRPWRSR